jgi:hypothetical protein
VPPNETFDHYPAYSVEWDTSIVLNSLSPFEFNVGSVWFFAPPIFREFIKLVVVGVLAPEYI